MVNKFVELLINYAKKNKDVVLLTADLGYKVLDPFIKEFPDRFYNVGVCEQNMIAVAGGLALEGKKVFIYSIATFLSMRGLDFIKNIISYYNLDINLIAVGSSFEYGKLGVSHYSVEDLSVINCIYNLDIYQPNTNKELLKVFNEVKNKTNPKYIKLSKDKLDYEISHCSLQPNLIIKGQNIALFASGMMIKEALLAQKWLKNKNIHISIYSCPCLNKINSVKLKEQIKDYQYIFTIDDQSFPLIGSNINKLILKTKKIVTVNNFYLKNQRFETVGVTREILKLYKLDGISIAKQMKKIIEQRK